MRRLNKIMAVSLFALTSLNVHAGFVKADWKVEGDNKAFVEEETGIEWLKTTITDHDGLDYDQTLANFGEGGVYEGWRVPTYQEVDALH